MSVKPRSIDNRPEITPEVLVWARERVRLSHEHLAKSCGCSPDEVAAWEAGTSRPSLSQLQTVASRCRRPIATFFLPETPPKPRVPDEHRSLGSAGPDSYSFDTALAIHSAIQAQEITKEILYEEGHTWSFQLPRLDTSMDASNAGKDFRRILSVTLADQRRWQDRYQALREWRAAVESLSVLVMQMPFPKSEGRAFCVFDEELPIIMLNTKDPPEARCFSLFHEVCHLGLGLSGVCTTRTAPTMNRSELAVELFCNRFASAVLLPDDDSQIHRQLERCVNGGTIDESALSLLAGELKVSRPVVLRTLLAMGPTTLEQVLSIEAKWESEFSGRGKGRRQSPAQECISRKGRRFSSLILNAVDSNVISMPDAASYLGLKIKDFSTLRRKIGG